MPSLIAALLLLATPLATSAAEPLPARAERTTSLSSAEGPTDEEVLAAWEKLDPDVQEEVVEWFRSEIIWLDTFQNKLLRFVLTDLERDPGTWPVVEPAPYYDPATHAPAQPIPRKALAPTSVKVEKKRAEFFFRVPERGLDSAWVYDYAARELRRTQRTDDPDRLFRNALRGFPPDLDLAEALVEMALDDGAEQKAAAAFAHAYTDRTGNVFTGLTLYDAWASASNMEMPDIDNLGVVHDLLDEWKKYVAPVPGHKQKPLYNTVGDLFQTINRHRGLRHAMAMTYLSGHPALRDGYGPNLERLHALWDKHESTPDKLLEDLPATKDWERFLKKWVAKHDRTKALAKAGVTRRDSLHNDGLWVRKTLVDIMLKAELLKPPK
jgi:hypothetical protein